MFTRLINWWRKKQEANRRADLIMRQLFQEMKDCMESYYHWIELNNWSIIIWGPLQNYRYRSEVCKVRLEPRDSGDVLIFCYGGWDVGRTEYSLTQKDGLLERVRTACKK